LQEIEAKLGLARQLGEAPPAPEPWTVERAARERLAHDFPGGDPAAKPVSEIMTKWIADRLEGLGRLSTREQGNLVQQVTEDFAYRSSDVSMNHSFARGGVAPTGHGIVDALMKEAGPAIGHMTAGEQQLLRADRQMLEFFANRGRAITAYAARKSALGLSK
jgi:hypothetical protein